MINGVVADLLFQNKFDQAHLPELIDLAVVQTGLGMLRSSVCLVKKSGTYWDSTQWGVFPLPFLGLPALAYANAIAAWSRNDSSPTWASDLASEIKRPMLGSLKYLVKTNDSFYQPSQKQSALTRSPGDWWKLAESTSPSQQIIALRHLEADGQWTPQRESMLLDKLRSSNRGIALHAIAAMERLSKSHWPVASDPITSELRMLISHRDDEVRAKSMCSIASLGLLDDVTIDTASIMLESHFKHIIFAGVYALSTLDSVPEPALPPFDRAFLRALQACDYEFVGLFAAAYNRWLDDPQSHVKGLLHDSPELLPVALDALDHVPEQLVSIG